jgi:hypothetical protein
MRPYFCSFALALSCTGSDLSPPPEPPAEHPTVYLEVDASSNQEVLDESVGHPDRNVGPSGFAGSGGFPVESKLKNADTGGSLSEFGGRKGTGGAMQRLIVSGGSYGSGGSSDMGSGGVRAVVNESCPFGGANIPLECSGGDRCIMISTGREFLCWCSEWIWMCRLLDADAGAIGTGSGGIQDAGQDTEPEAMGPIEWPQQCKEITKSIEELRTASGDPFICVHMTHGNWSGMLLCPNTSAKWGFCNADQPPGCKVAGYECSY